MSERLEALRGSIRKWENIVNNSGEDDGLRNCPLCFQYFENYCRGCPVYKKTGKDRCDGTPYTEWVYHQYRFHSLSRKGFRVMCDKCREIAIDELNFLKSLLPKKKEKELRKK